MSQTEQPKRTLGDEEVEQTTKRFKVDLPEKKESTSSSKLTDMLIAKVERTNTNANSCTHMVAYGSSLYPIDVSIVGELARLRDYESSDQNDSTEGFPYTDLYRKYENDNLLDLRDEIVLDDTLVCPSSFPLPTLEVIDRVQTNLSKITDSLVLHNLNPAEMLKPNDLPMESPLLPGSRLMHKLSPFQIHASAALRMKHNVLVTAHTGAGKTLLAHVLISLYLAMGKRVVYTTPIKALSNDKYNELSQCYSSVGLVTGDSSINPEAQIVIVTTEVLRNEALRSGGEVNYSAVIFDEVHYMKDKERGVVWEESILSIGNRAQMLFLSATLRNDKDFALWINSCTNRPCHIVGTVFRPVPLVHLVVPVNGEGIHLVADSNKTFDSAAFDLARSTIKQKASASKFGKPELKNTISRTIASCVENNWLPMIIFSFSRKELEMYALDCIANIKKNANSVEGDSRGRQGSGFRRGHIDLTTDEEKNQITSFFQHFPDDVDCTVLKGMLLRGIGIHHSGLLPRVRECVEHQLRKNQVKLLFATETFAMGVNVPVRCVAFTSGVKFDGSTTRALTSAEYTQMAGRAGRRGHDTLGVCMYLDDGLVSQEEFEEMVCGPGEEMEGRLVLSYNLVLNQLNRSEEVEKIVNDSLGMFLFRKYVEAGSLSLNLDHISQGTLTDAQTKLLETNYANAGLLTYAPPTETAMQPYLVPGRVVYVGSPIGITSSNLDYGWSVVVNVRKTHITKYELIVLTCINQKFTGRSAKDLTTFYQIGPQSQHVGSVLRLSDAAEPPPLPAINNAHFVLDVISIRPELIKYVSSVRIPMPNSVKGEDERIAVWKNLTTAHIVHKNSKTLSGNLDFPILPIHEMDKNTADPWLTRSTQDVNKFQNEIIARRQVLQASIQDMSVPSNTSNSVSGLELQRLMDRELQKKNLSLEYGNKTRSLAKTTQKVVSKDKPKGSSVRGSQFIVDSQSENMKEQFLKVHAELQSTLERVGFVDKNTREILLPGRIARYVDSVDCIVLATLLTEMNVSTTSPSHFAAILSAFFPREKLSTDDSALDKSLEGEWRLLEKVVMDLDKLEYTPSAPLKYGLMYAIKCYAESTENELGAICNACNMFPGSFARVLSRIVNQIVQIEEAAANIGAEDLTKLAADARKMVHKGSVFLSSLYFPGE